MSATKKDIALVNHDLELMGGNLASQIDDLRQDNNKRFDKLENALFALVGTVSTLAETVGTLVDTVSELTNTVNDIKKSVDVNTDSMGSLTKEFREIKKIEFQVYNHENRLKQLEVR